MLFKKPASSHLEEAAGHTWEASPSHSVDHGLDPTPEQVDSLLACLAALLVSLENRKRFPAPLRRRRRRHSFGFPDGGLVIVYLVEDVMNPGETHRAPSRSLL